MRARTLVAALLVAGCSAAPASAALRSTSAGPTATATASASPSSSPTPATTQPKPSRRPSPVATHASGAGSTFTAVVAAGGVRQWLQCSGRGPLTLVVIPGLSTSATAWTGVLGPFQQLLRTCIYDRPGIGLSPPRPDPRQVVDAGMLAGELWSLLQTAGERGPYVVLGHSFGGLIGRAFVAAHRSSVRAVLLAESVSPYDAAGGRYWIEAGHEIDLHASSVATDDGPRMGSTPLIVLSASNPDENHLGGPTYGQPAWMTTLWIQQQAQDPSLSSSSIQVIAHSGHVLQQDDPPAVIESVRELVSAVRTGRRLTCYGPWASVAATCR